MTYKIPSPVPVHLAKVWVADAFTVMEEMSSLLEEGTVEVISDEEGSVKCRLNLVKEDGSLIGNETVRHVIYLVERYCKARQSDSGYYTDKEYGQMIQEESSALMKAIREALAANEKAIIIEED